MCGWKCGRTQVPVTARLFPHDRYRVTALYHGVRRIGRSGASRERRHTRYCNRHHSVKQQLCQWLLLTLDRLPANELIMTHGLVASAFGVRRETITEAAGNLQRDGLIGYRRGHIAVFERSGLEAGACECYARLCRPQTGRIKSFHCS
jgi:CRP-like cAMP-binding protein